MALTRMVLEKARHGLLAGSLVRQLQRIGFHFVPYYVQIIGGVPVKSEPPLFEILFSEANNDDLEQIAIQERSQGSWQPPPLERIRRGHKCYVLRREGRVVANCWSCRGSWSSYSITTSMLPSEGYLYVSLVESQYRGHGFAPYLWRKCMQALAADGVDTFYSEAEYFNRPARRFQQKTGARKIRLHIYLRFRSIERNWILRRY